MEEQIDKCLNDDCALASGCLRYLLPPNGYKVSTHYDGNNPDECYIGLDDTTKSILEDYGYALLGCLTAEDFI